MLRGVVELCADKGESTAVLVRKDFGVVVVDGLLFADVDRELVLLPGTGGVSSGVELNLLTKACNDPCRPRGT